MLRFRLLTSLSKKTIFSSTCNCQPLFSNTSFRKFSSEEDFTTSQDLDSLKFGEESRENQDLSENADPFSSFFPGPSTKKKSATKILASFTKLEKLHSHVLSVHASMNNTILLLATNENKVLLTASCGTAGFKKARRAGFEPAYQAATQLVEKVNAKNYKINGVVVKFKGFGPGREAAFRAIRANTDWQIVRLIDATPIPFNGCRPPKPRRL